MKDKTIYELDLHEELQVDKYTTVMAVDGGWIYTRMTTAGGIAMVFVETTREYDPDYDEENEGQDK